MIGPPALSSDWLYSKWCRSHAAIALARHAGCTFSGRGSFDSTKSLLERFPTMADQRGRGGKKQQGDAEKGKQQQGTGMPKGKSTQGQQDQSAGKHKMGGE